MTSGRPTKLTPALHNAIVEKARRGANYEGCARAGGIAPSTLYNWLERGRSSAVKNAPFKLFLEAFIQARSAHELTMLAAIEAAATGKGPYSEKASVKAAFWMLERAYGYNRSGAGALARTPAPKNETPEQENLRVLQRLFDDGQALGLSPDRALPLWDALQAAKAAMGLAADTAQSQEEIVGSLATIPTAILEAALAKAREDEADK